MAFLTGSEKSPALALPPKYFLIVSFNSWFWTMLEDVIYFSLYILHIERETCSLTLLSRGWGRGGGAVARGKIGFKLFLSDFTDLRFVYCRPTNN